MRNRDGRDPATTKWRDPGRGFDVTALCIDCNRFCLVCGYPIDGGWEHVQQPQPEGASHTVCKLERAKRPMAERITTYLDHVHYHQDPPDVVARL